MSPSQQELLALHVRFVNGDGKAAGEICDHLFACLVRRLSQAHGPVLDEHVYLDAVSKALEEYVLKPARYKPAKGPLDGYLLMRARHHLSHTERQERRREEKLKKYKICVADALRQGYLNVESEMADLMAALDGFLEQLNPIEREFVALHRAGVHDTEEYFKVLKAADPGVAGADRETRQLVVKNYWDRLLKKLKPMAKRL